MFGSARIKLTIWYSLTIIFISIFFSTIIYFQVDHQLQLSYLRGHMALMEDSYRPKLTEEYIEEIKLRLKTNLLLINLIILLGEIGMSYFLAGRTLKPIEEAMEEQKRFVGDASHELRTPLSILKTSTEVALRNKNSSSNRLKIVLRENLEEIDHLQRLMNNLLFLSSREKLNNVKIRFDIVKLTRDVAKKMTIIARKKKLGFSIETPKKCFAKGDKITIERLILIFLDNAIKYTEKGYIKLQLKCERKNIVLIFKDTGSGVSKKNKPYIFNRFWRASKSRGKTGRIGGFGLGLSLAKKIVTDYKGSIKLINNKGKGLTFIVQLPIRNSL